MKSTDCIMWGIRREKVPSEEGKVQPRESQLRPTRYRQLRSVISIPNTEELTENDLKIFESLYFSKPLSNLRKMYNNRDKSVKVMPVGLDTFSKMVIEGTFFVKTYAKKEFCKQFFHYDVRV